jgi:hypothetical protein
VEESTIQTGMMNGVVNLDFDFEKEGKGVETGEGKGVATSDSGFELRNCACSTSRPLSMYFSEAIVEERKGCVNCMRD